MTAADDQSYFHWMQRDILAVDAENRAACQARKAKRLRIEADLCKLKLNLRDLPHSIVPQKRRILIACSSAAVVGLTIWHVANETVVIPGLRRRLTAQASRPSG